MCTAVHRLYTGCVGCVIDQVRRKQNCVGLAYWCLCPNVRCTAEPRPPYLMVKMHQNQSDHGNVCFPALQWAPLKLVDKVLGAIDCKKKKNTMLPVLSKIVSGKCDQKGYHYQTFILSLVWILVANRVTNGWLCLLRFNYLILRIPCIDLQSGPVSIASAYWLLSFYCS